MKQLILSSLICATALLSGCTGTLEDTIQPLETRNAQILQTKAVPESSDSGRVTEEFVMSEDMKKMKERYIRFHPQCKNTLALNDDRDYDDTFGSNMYAIRELPATIKVRSNATSGSTYGYLYLYCEGRGDEVVLSNSDDMTNNRFYIRVLPPSTGVQYLIYSKASGTPLSIGYYTSDPDDKILMAAKKENILLMNAGWDFLWTGYYKNYYTIQSRSYLGQSNPNSPWSIFYYVLEAVSGDRIRYAKREKNKAQQEFIITPDAKFDIVSLEYDVASYSTRKSIFSKTVTVKNTSREVKDINVPFDFHEIENSYFGKNSWTVNLNFSNTGIRFKRPSVINGKVVSPEVNSLEDALFLSNGRQMINRHIVYTHPIRCKASSIAMVTLKFVKYDVTVKYTVKAQCVINGNVRECILKGTWSGSIIEDPKEITPESTIAYFPIDSGGNIILGKKYIRR